jgi:hypothetical protein
MKKAVLAIILITNAICAKAQKQIVDSVHINATIQNSEYIFEGEIVEQCSYKSNGEIYTASFIQLSKAIKGLINEEIVTLITLGGQIGNEGLTVSHTTKFNTEFVGVFFCNKTRYGFNNETCNDKSSALKLSTTYMENSQIQYFDDGYNYVAQGLNCKFNSLQNVYDYFQSKINTPTTCFKQVQFLQPFINYSSTKKVVVINENESKAINLKKNSASKDISYKFANGRVTGSVTKKFEFDVQIKANDSLTYLDQGAFRIKFNSVVFGTNIATVVTASLDSKFPITTYPTVTKINKQTDVVSIWVKPASYGKPRTKITTSYQTLVHLTIPMLNCAEYPTLALDTFSNILVYSTFASFPTNPTIQTYTSVDLSATMLGKTCEPFVDNVYSLSTGSRNVVGGVKEQIKIEGKHFGPNNGKLFMLNSNVNREWAQFDSYDLDSSLANYWSDTAIVFTLPSILDNGTSATPGSGNVGVRNKWKGIADTTFFVPSIALKVNYSITNKFRLNPFDYKAPKILASSNIDSGYTFYFHNNIPAQMKLYIIAAINKWRCFTGVNFKIAAITTNDTIKVDNKCVIRLDTFPDDYKDYIAFTYVNDVVCNINGNKPLPVQGIDMNINLNFSQKFFYDTTGNYDKPAGMVDFYSYILHELGHAHCLSHVVDEKDLMHYGQEYAPLINKFDRKIKFNINNRNGGDWIIKHSVDLSSYSYSSSCTYTIPMVMQDTSCRKIANALNNKQTIDNTIIISPNPTYNIVTIKFDTEDYWSIRVYNLQGELVNELINERLHSVELNTTEWTKGVYFIRPLS